MANLRQIAGLENLPMSRLPKLQCGMRQSVHEMNLFRYCVIGTVVT